MHSVIVGVRQIYRPGFRRAKAGVMLVDLQQQEVALAAFDFDEPAQAGVRSEASLASDEAKLMTAFDAVNQRFGRGSLQLAAAGLPRK